MTLPLFSDLEGTYYTLPALPPCHFTGMNTQLFPLRANLDTLQQFCNRYSNILPHELGWFRVFMPYVYFTVIDYGKMASAGSNQGWLSQHEVMFTFPVEWYRLEDGKWRFQQWCWLTPYIFVDSETSLVLGRTVWGWPKSLIQVVPSKAAALGSPTETTPLLRMSTWVFPKAYAGCRQERRMFLEVNRSPQPSMMRVPATTDNPFLPWNMASQLFTGAVGVFSDYLATLTGMGRAPNGALLYPGNLTAMMRSAAEQLDPAMRSSFFSTVCLKQFRDATEPQNYCYQALTIARMQVTSLNQCGLLGDSEFLLGDQSCGYSIDLWNWPTLPIADTLGLEVAERWQDGDVERVRVKPVLPIWYDVNMLYNLGHNIAWRSFDREWHDPQGRIYPPLLGVDAPDEARFNTSAGPAGQTLSGPFFYPAATLRILPLLASRATLESFLQRYLNEPLTTTNQRFRLWAPANEESAYVYLVVTNFQSVYSEGNNVGSWANYKLSFLVPVIQEEIEPSGTRKVLGVGLVPSFTYVDDLSAAITNSEVYGIPTSRGIFVRPSSAWMNPEGIPPDPEQPLLRVAIEILPAMGEGQEVVHRVTTDIREIDSRKMSSSPLDSAAESFCRLVSHELERKYKTKLDHSADLKNARSVALGVLAGEVPVNLYTLKQFRDVTYPDRACYQSITSIQRSFDEVFMIREMETPIQVQIHEYPSQPIVKLLGLKYRERRAVDGEMIYTIDPVRPFWVNASMTDSLGTRVLYRAGDSTWIDIEKKPHEQNQASPVLTGARQLDLLLNDIPPVGLKTLWGASQSIPRGERRTPIAPQDIASAIEQIDPQMVLESILSREWEDRSEHARWARARERLNRELAELLEKTELPQHASAQSRFISKQLKRAKAGPYQPDVYEQVVSKQKILEKLTKLAPRFAQISHRLHESEECEGDSLSPSRPTGNLGLQASLEELRELLKSHTEVDALPLYAQLDLVSELQVPLDKMGFSLSASLASSDFVPLRDAYRKEVDRLAKMVSKEHERLLGVILDKLAKAWQKPDFCVRRDLAGTSQEQIFPRLCSWNEDWFVGRSYK